MKQLIKILGLFVLISLLIFSSVTGKAGRRCSRLGTAASEQFN